MSRKVTMTVDEASYIWEIISGMSISKLERPEQKSILNANRVLRPIGKAFADFRKDAQERLRPENYDELAEKQRRFDKLTPDEQAKVNKAVAEYNASVIDVIGEESRREVEIELSDTAPLTDDALCAISEANPNVSVRGLMLIQDKLG